METQTPKKTDIPAITEWITQRIAHVLEIEINEVDPQLQFADMGIDSVMAVSLVSELEKHLEREFEPTLLYTHPTIAELAAFLNQEQSA